MEIQQHYLSVRKTARFATLGNISEKTKYLWIVLHGSKMTCEQMLYKFTEFDADEHFVVAPEGLNRFYANGFGGDVVASWMTSRDRLHEIDDFSNYLTDLYHYHIDLLPEDITKVFLGFSQGGTTMFRWLHHTKIDTDVIIPYSCWIPEDIDLRKSKTELSDATTIFTYGTKDQFINEKVISDVMKVIQRNELQVSIEPYEGDHRVDRKQLQKLFSVYITH